MGERLKLALLGPLQVARGETDVTERTSGKAQALLCYLAVTGRSQSRSVLADLLWSEMPEEAARSNLRMALSNLRREVEPYLTVTRDSLGFNVESPYWLDVGEFARLVTPVSRLAESRLRDEEVASLTEAVRLYRGDFLEGFYVRDAPVFEGWVLTERERLRQLALQALNSLATHHTHERSYGVASDYTARLLALEPWLEEAHQQMMRLLALRGQQGAALAQYEICRRVLAEELGVEPSEETVALYEQIRRGEIGERSAEPERLAPRRAAPSHNLPPQLTPFFGREEELDQIAGHLGEPDYRLISIVGPGGIGKTRLAVQVASQRVEGYADGVYFIALADLEAPELIVPAIADCLGLSFQGQEPPRSQLLNFLRDKETLLVLDNFEHLLDGAELVLEMLRTTRRVALLVTSRERLSLQAESVLRLRGLPFPQEASDPQAMDYSAVRLFVERAGRASMGFKPSERTLPDVARICQLVEGRPLGLELAAAWVGEHTCAEIAAAIQRNLDFLATTMRDIPERHRSIRAVFEHSWQLLSGEERFVFARLSVFRGGFQGEAALEVAEASPALLAALKRKSLLREAPTHRFHLHELVRQYAEERLAETPQARVEAQQRHSAYYATFLREREPELKGGNQSEALDAIRGEIENVQAGWRWAVAQGGEVEKYQNSLYLFYDTRNWLQEGEEAFGSALSALEQANGSERARLRGQLLARQGLFCRRRGDFDRARALLQESVTLLLDAGNPAELAFSLNNLGYAVYRLGDYEAAKRLLRESIGLYREVGDQWGTANALNNLGMVVDVDQHEEGQALFKESYEIRKALGDQRGMALCLNNWGVSVEMQGRYEQATRLYQESLALCREIGDRWIMGMVLSNLGDVATTLREFDGARRYYLESLEGAVKIGAVPEVILILVKIASLLVQEERPEEALDLLGVVLHHPATHGETREQADGLLAQIASALPQEVVAVQLGQATSRQFDEVVEAVLAEATPPRVALR